MILFKIEFFYRGKEIEGSVHELETHPKQWHITITDKNLPSEFQATHIISYNYQKQEYNWGFSDSDIDHTFANSMAKSLIDYITKYGWNSVII